MREPIVVLDQALRVIVASRSFYPVNQTAICLKAFDDGHRRPDQLHDSIRIGDWLQLTGGVPWPFLQKLSPRWKPL